MKCVRETEILVEQQTPQGVLVCDHAGLVIKKFSCGEGCGAPLVQARERCGSSVRESEHEMRETASERESEKFLLVRVSEGE